MEIIDRAKKIINGYYSGDIDKMYIPEDIVSDVFDLTAAMTNKMEQCCVFHDHLADDILFKCAINHCQNNPNSLRQFIAFSYIKQVQQYVSFVESIPSNVNKSLVVLSNLDLETMCDPFSFVLFDNRVAIILETGINGGFFLTTNDSILDNCRLWLNVPTIDEQSINSSFLQEPLMFSADMMSEVALVLCSCDHVNMEGCYWYHSVWQYLRLMNMVSTPSWHHRFYVEQISEAIKPFDNPHVLISGAADYSSLSYAIQVIKASEKQGDFSVLDLCETPLFVCKWYAKKEDVKVHTICCSIFDFNVINQYTLICTDAFLTRFSKDDIKRVVSIWYDALTCGGSVVTTVRIHDETHTCPDTPSEEDVMRFRQKAFERSKIWGNVINYSQEQISLMAETYARKMKSNSVGSKEEILDVFYEIGFSISYLEDIEVQGELYPSRYLRIRATKK